jgi:hypothetical protein
MTKNLFRIFHQNIIGMNGKSDELMISLNNQPPNVFYLTDNEIDAIHISKYNLGAKFSRKNLKNGELYTIMTIINESLKG